MIHAVPPRQEGRYGQSSPNVRRDAVDASSDAHVFVRTNGAAADGEVVWSWRPDAGAKSCGHDPRGDGGKKARFPRESTKDPVKTAAQGRPDVRPILW